MRGDKFNYKYLNLNVNINEYLNFSERDIRKLKFIANTIKFCLTNIPEIIGRKRKDAEKILDEICNELQINLNYNKIEKEIRNMKGKKKDERKEYFISVLENEFKKVIENHIKNKEILKERLKNINEKLKNETNERIFNHLLTKKQEIEKELKLLENEEMYRKVNLNLFFDTIKKLENKIDLLIGKIMEIDVLENDLIHFRYKYEKIIQIINNYCRNMKI